MRTDVPVKTVSTPVEDFSMEFTPRDKGANLVIAWENVSVSLPIDIAAAAVATTTKKK
jgi:hypothetical protein